MTAVLQAVETSSMYSNVTDLSISESMGPNGSGDSPHSDFLWVSRSLTANNELRLLKACSPAFCRWVWDDGLDLNMGKGKEKSKTYCPPPTFAFVGLSAWNTVFWIFTK